MTAEAISRARRIAARQFGVITRNELRSLGLADRTIDRLLGTGHLVRIHESVYSFPGHALGTKGRLYAAARWAGPCAVVSHRSAAFCYQFDGQTGGLVELTIGGRKGSKLADAVIHRTNQLPRCDVTRFGVIPITTPTRTIIDLAGVVSELDLEIALDSALRVGKTSLAKLQRRIDVLGQRGRRGIGPLKRLLKERDPNAAPSESVLETRLARLIRRSGLPVVTAQKVVHDDAGFVGRLDFVYPERKLVIEAHSYAYHSSRSAMDRDVDRWNRLRAANWRLIIVMWHHVTGDPEGVVKTIRMELARAAAQPSLLR